MQIKLETCPKGDGPQEGTEAAPPTREKLGLSACWQRSVVGLGCRYKYAKLRWEAGPAKWAVLSEPFALYVLWRGAGL